MQRRMEQIRLCSHVCTTYVVRVRFTRQTNIATQMQMYSPTHHSTRKLKYIHRYTRTWIARVHAYACERFTIYELWCLLAQYIHLPVLIHV